MAVVQGDITHRYTEPNGPGDTNAGAAATSLGGFAATNEPTSGASQNAYGHLVLADNSGGAVHYRAFFVANTDGADTWYAVKVWIASQSSNGADHAIALDGVGVVDLDSASAQGETEADEDTAPTGETFTSPTSKDTGINVGDVGPGQGFTVWVRRTGTGSPALSGAFVAIRWEGQDAAP